MKVLLKEASCFHNFSHAASLYITVHKPWCLHRRVTVLALCVLFVFVCVSVCVSLCFHCSAILSTPKICFAQLLACGFLMNPGGRSQYTTKHLLIEVIAYSEYHACIQALSMRQL